MIFCYIFFCAADDDFCTIEYKNKNLRL